MTLPHCLSVFLSHCCFFFFDFLAVVLTKFETEDALAAINAIAVAEPMSVRLSVCLFVCLPAPSSQAQIAVKFGWQTEIIMQSRASFIIEAAKRKSGQKVK